MAATNTPLHYGSVTKTFHWLTALLILTAIPLGIIANKLPYDTDAALAQKALVFSLHKTVGITAFFVALARILWALTQPKPIPLHPDRKLETFAAETVHWSLYMALILVPAMGWAHHASATGFAPIWWPFGQTLPFIPQDPQLSETFASLHIIFERVLALSIILHVAGALKHRFIDRDATLARMWPGPPPSVHTTLHKHPKAPILAAAALYAAALGVGAAIGMFSHTATASPTLAAPATSEWQVTDGTLSITVQQLGAPVTGSFADWTAEINFDPDTGTGDTTVTINTASLTLGSVTTQALSADFFDANTHPTAIFSAAITPADTGHTADGTLTLRGITVPVTLPFTLELGGDTARMTGSTRLDRRAFEMGISYPDESSVGFGVDVNITLTATRSNN